MNRMRLGALALAAAVVLILPSVSWGQRFWGGGWRGGRAAYYNDGGAYNYGYGPRWYRSGYYYPSDFTYQQPGYRSAAYPPDSAFDSMPSDQGARVLANIRLPEASAQLWIEGQEMSTQGLVRSFISPPLEAGARYTYTIKAQWTENGKPMEATRQVPVRPGQRVMVDFTAPERGPAPRTQRRSGYGPNEGAATPRNEEKVKSPSEAEKPTPRSDQDEKPTPRTKQATPPVPPERPRDNPPDRNDKQPPE